MTKDQCGPGVLNDALVSHRSDPDARAVLEDWRLEQGWGPDRTYAILAIIINADVADDAAADDSATDDAAEDDDDADDPDAAADDANNASANDAADDADDDVAVNAAGGVDGRWPLLEEPNMREGLKLIQIHGRYGYAVTIVGRLRRVAGDEYVMEPGARTIVRTSGSRTLAELAADGPAQDHRLMPPTRVEEEIHRLTVRRSLVASEAAWGEHVKAREKEVK